MQHINWSVDGWGLHGLQDNKKEWMYAHIMTVGLLDRYHPRPSRLFTDHTVHDQQYDAYVCMGRNTIIRHACLPRHGARCMVYVHTHHVCMSSTMRHDVCMYVYVCVCTHIIYVHNYWQLHT